MNSLSLSVITMIHYNVIIRDTLEYTLDKESYITDAFNFRKKGVLVEIDQPTPLKQFIDKNADTIGKQIIDEVNNLYSTVYADDSTICHVNGKELRVDKAQHIAIFDTVIPLHEDVKKVVDAHINFARSKNLLDEQLMRLVIADERLYRGIVLLCLFNDLDKLFLEYNKARNEAKGAITPQSNFIQNDLKKITDHIDYVIKNQSATEYDYWDVVDFINKVVAMTQGRRQLPPEKKFQDMFKEGHEILNKYVNACETTWKDLYNPALQELITKSKENNGQLKVGDDLKVNENNGGGNN